MVPVLRVQAGVDVADERLKVIERKMAGEFRHDPSLGHPLALTPPRLGHGPCTRFMVLPHS